MSMPLEEHDYIGLSDVPSMDNSEKSKVSCKDLNLKATELRLGLPGSESPERECKNGVLEEKNGYSLGVLKGLVSGAKRGFSDTIDGGSGKWVFSGTGGSDVDSAKNGGLSSPRSSSKTLGSVGSEIKNQQSVLASSAGKEPAPHSPKPSQEKKPQSSAASSPGVAPASKAQVVGWPPVRSFRKNSMATNLPKNEDDANGKLGTGCLYVKVSMDGAPYLRKVDLKTYNSYKDLSSALDKMFSCFTIDYVLTYEDKDGDWMLVGDVPWEMFRDSCKRLRIMKSSDAIGLAPRALEKSKNRY